MVNGNYAPFQSIRQTVKITGLSERYLRERCKSGDVPHIMCGKKTMVNVPALLKKLGV